MFYPVRVLFEGRRRRGTVDFYKDEQKQAKDYVYGPACFFCVETERTRMQAGIG